MYLQDIKEFVTLANIGNFQDAAQELYLSQSTLSRHIQRLEKELQNKLFDRTTRSTQLSNFGRFFLPYAQEWVCIEHDFRKEYNHFNTECTETIHVGAIPTMASYHFTDVLANFKYQYPNYGLEIEEITTMSALFERLASGELDFALIHDPEIPDKRIVHIPFMVDQIVAALPKTHPLAKSDSLQLQVLKKEVFVTPPMPSVITERFLSRCKDSDFSPKISYSGHREDVLLSLVRNHFGIAIVSECNARYTGCENIQLIELSPAIVLPVSIVYARTISLTTGKKMFLKCLGHLDK